MIGAIEYRNTNYAKVETYYMLLEIDGVEEFKNHKDPKTEHYSQSAYLDIPASKWYYLKIHTDGTISAQEHDPGDPGGAYVFGGLDIFFEKIPKEVAKKLCFHLDLFRK